MVKAVDCQLTDSGIVTRLFRQLLRGCCMGQLLHLQCGKRGSLPRSSTKYRRGNMKDEIKELKEKIKLMKEYLELLEKCKELEIPERYIPQPCPYPQPLPPYPSKPVQPYWRIYCTDNTTEFYTA